MYKNYHGALNEVSSILFAGLQSFENDFAPLPTVESDTLLQILLDLVGLGALVIAAPYFDKCEYLRQFYFPNHISHL